MSKKKLLILYLLSKALCEFFKRGRLHKLSIQCHLKFIDNIFSNCFVDVKSGGLFNFAILDRFHLKFCKSFQNFKQWTPDPMVYGELGRYPIRSKKTRMISYWSKWISGEDTKCSVWLGLEIAAKIEGTLFVLKISKVVLNQSGFFFIFRWNKLHIARNDWKQKLNLYWLINSSKIGNPLPNIRHRHYRMYGEYMEKKKTTLTCFQKILIICIGFTYVITIYKKKVGVGSTYQENRNM